MKNVLKIILLVGWIVVIFNFSLQSGDVSGNMSNSLLDQTLDVFIDIENFKSNNYETYYLLGTIIRKIAHLTEYCILGVISYIVFKNYKYALLLGIVIACIDETIQLFVPARSGMFIDVLIDTTGVIIGLLLIKLFSKKVYL